jgi:hypothetical protein
MAYYCREVSEWIEETIEQPVEEWVEEQSEKCAEEECNWLLLCANKLVCWTVIVLVKVVTFVLVTVPRLVTRVVCEIVSVPIIALIDTFTPIACAFGLSFSRRDRFDLQDAILFAKISLEAYEDDGDADWNAIDSSLNQLAFFQGITPIAGLYPLDTQVYVLEETGAQRLIVGFRGSAGLIDWINNLTALPVPHLAVTNGVVHGGFNAAYLAVRQNLVTSVVGAIIERLGTDDAIQQVCFTGHSLGGAMASFAAFDFRFILADDLAVRHYTYGAPKIGNTYVTFDFDGMIPDSFRMVNAGDPVPKLPAPGGPTKYRHVKTLVFFDPDGTMTVDPCPQPVYDWPAQISKYLPAGLDAAVSYTDAAIALGISAAGGFPEHDMNLYISNLEAQA